MAYIKIEPTGCCIYKGRIQVRLSFILEPTDPRYNEHHIYVIDETSQEWRDNPFHNHFIFVDADTPDSKVQEQAQNIFQEFFTGWCEGRDMVEVWKSKKRPAFVAKTLLPNELLACKVRLTQIKAMGVG